MGRVRLQADFLDDKDQTSDCPDFLVGDDLVAQKPSRSQNRSGCDCASGQNAPIVALYLLFAGEGTVDAWNSWRRAPRPPGKRPSAGCKWIALPLPAGNAAAAADADSAPDAGRFSSDDPGVFPDEPMAPKASL